MYHIITVYGKFQEVLMKNKIRERRKEMNISQTKLAAMCGFAASALSDFENDRRLPWKKARESLCKVLEKTEGELFPAEVVK